MSLARGVVALYASQAYGIAVSIAVTPAFLRLLGPEGYGLVGIFIVLHAWLQVLDLGVPILLTRQVARSRAGAASPDDVRSGLRFLELMFLLVGVLAVGLLMGGIDTLATKWLSVRTLPDETVRHALMAMGVACGIRWMTSPYRAAIAGTERFVWLACVSAVFATLRFVAVLPWVYAAAHPIEAFFTAQVVLGALELAVMGRRTYACLPDGRATAWREGFRLLNSGGQRLGWSMALATVLWLLTTQADRVILSKALSLAEYGYYTLALTVAGAIVQVTAPVVQAMVPRLNYLNAAGDEGGLHRDYRRMTQLVTAISACLASVLAAHAESVVFVWTGDVTTAKALAPTLATYAVAQALLAVVALPYNLQLAKGDLRLHLIGSALMLAALAPAIAWAGMRWGAVGAGGAWIVVLLAYLLTWTPVAHQRFAPNVHARWIAGDVVRTALPAVAITLLSLLAAALWPSGRLGQLLALGGVLGAACASTYAFVPSIRSALAPASIWRTTR